LTLYHEKFKDLPVAFAPARLRDTLGELVSRAGLRQLRISESEKFAHVTFFLDGGSHLALHGKDECCIPSPKGIPFDQHPAMNLPDVTRNLIHGIEQAYDLIVANFANGDVIGHTSSCDAKVRCAEIIDHHLGIVVEKAMAADYVILITADHGNLEVMLTPEGSPHVAHTTNPVPFLLIDPHKPSSIELREGGQLACIAPTMLKVLDLAQPKAMSGSNLALHHDWGGRRRILLLILDGWGIGKVDPTNPIFLAETPHWDRLLDRFSSTRLSASGEAVGLQPGKSGNSEAGHMNIGAGRIVIQDDVRLDQAMKDGSFSSNEILDKTIRDVKERKKKLHLIGLLTEKSSHGSIDYPLKVLQMAKDMGLEDVYLHVIFDGRSTEPGSAPDLLEKLERQMDAIGTGQIASGVGRGIALDRDGNYARTQKAYEAMVLGIGNLYCPKGVSDARGV
ncbi:MAG: phosphoglycerate mutase (2,3-diphosphoglycerate-independent), partial [Chloroflexi bacterium]